MKELHPDEGLRIFDIKWSVTTAGPSPNNNERIEVFLLGCEKAINGYPCKGCFNSVTWDKSIAEFSRDPIEVADMINEKCDPNNKYITIGGGEPTDQIDALIPFVIRLKEHGFHILMYTWRELKDIMLARPADEFTNYPIDKLSFKQKFETILRHIDILVDGEYRQEETLLSIGDSNTARNFVGSGNQIVWDTGCVTYGFALKDITNLYMFKKDRHGEENILYYETIENSEMQTLR